MQIPRIYIDGAQAAVTEVPRGGRDPSGIGRDRRRPGVMGIRETRQTARGEHGRIRDWPLTP